MRLEEYWGIGPKTSELLARELGVEAAVRAIESADVRTLTQAGLPRGRATRILRRATGGQAMNVLATRDTREVYKEVLDLASEYAVTDHAADRIRVLTPLSTVEEMQARLDRVLDASEAWAELDETTRGTVLDAFSSYGGEEGSDLAAVRTALALLDAGIEEVADDDGVFGPLAALDRDALSDAAAALAGLEGGGDRVGEGADEDLDRLREQLGAVEDLSATPSAVLDEVQSGARGTADFRDGLVQYVTAETGVDLARVREAVPSEATDARDFVTETLRGLSGDLRSEVDEREQEVADRLADVLDETSEAVETAVRTVDDVALYVSLARFARAYDLRAARYVTDRDVIAVRNARNLSLLATESSVQEVNYAIGEHDIEFHRANAPPRDDSVAVLTGANSGGKTTLLETLCQVQLLAQMGLPVPAEEATVSVVDSVVFHRRHASFNAGVLEATLRSVVPPLADEGQTLMLVDEFEAITEPGSAADLLHGLVTLTVEKGALGVFVTHLADDLEPLPEQARTDGIFAEGLTPDLELQVDYQPRFGTVGKSTPEFIVSRLVADAGDHLERAGFETLAQAVGESAVQRTLADARWTE
ncbi:DNA mismatch repair protein [Haloarculaceae archaeon H-GB1-1]|nr:DNA mismatch repair protein [Haloarculaceae archaeon H-GB1-1]